MQDQHSHLFRTRIERLLIAMFVAVGSSMSLAAGASRATSEPGPTIHCAGLQCGTMVTGAFVPEAHGELPAVVSVEELLQQPNSGFYKMPALIYQGDMRPRVVVYLARAGQHDRMPWSVRQLAAIQNLVRADALGADSDETFVVADRGLLWFFADDQITPRTADDHVVIAGTGCNVIVINRVFCLWEDPNLRGDVSTWDGPTYFGTGWWNLGTSFGSSQINARGGDTLLADHGLGSGTRYCARQDWSDDTFADNAIGNGNASSVALLSSRIDRC